MKVNALNLPESLLLTSDIVAQLCGISERHTRRNCDAAKYPGATKGADGWIIPLTSLPAVAQARYWEAQPPEIPNTPPLALPILASPPAVIDSDALHLAFRQAPAKSKARATKLYEAVTAFEALCTAGESKGRAQSYVKETYQVDAATLWRAREAVKGHPQHLWEALLLPKYKGRTKEAEITPAAWDWICANYLNTSETAAKIVIKEAKKEGKALGWVFPSDRTIIRKLNKLPAPESILGRKGNEAFNNNYPAAIRDFTAYALHEQWVTDGTRCDVRCIWPDGTTGRPFIVGWMDMRSRYVCGIRGALNPSQRLTAASLYTALQEVNIKPESGLFDRGSEYLAGSISGGQLPNGVKRNDGELPGRLKRMGIKAEFARAYHGQAKPKEKFWDYIKENVDKLPMFQKAYVGKDAVSKPEDYNPKNAIPIEIYSAKFAEIISEYNNSHKHTGVGMYGRTPVQVYEELMQAEPHKEWARPTAEDFRLLCLEQVVRTLDNKNGGVQITIKGYGKMRYWSATLANLPESARSKKYIVFYNPDAPELPVLVYDGVRFICEAKCQDKIGNKDQAAQHYIEKTKFLKPHKAAVKAIKNAAPQALPAPAANVLPFMPIEIIGKPAAPVATPEKPKLEQLENGQFYNPLTGETIGKAHIETAVEPEIDITEHYQRKAEQLAAERLKRRFGTT